MAFDYLNQDNPWIPSRSIANDYSSLEAQDRTRQATAQVLPSLSTPTAPTISQSLTALPMGFQFSFNVLDPRYSITSYHVYRNTTNDAVNAALFQTIVQPTNNTAQIVVQDITPGVNQTRYYWVSSVNTAGLESGLTNAQTAAVTSRTVSGRDVANSATAYTPNSNPLTQDATTTNIKVASFTIQYTTGLVSYNSGATDPGSYGTYYIYCDDATRAGGAQVYHSITQNQQVTASDPRIYLGKITTAGGGGGTGSGGGDGPCFSGNTRLQGGTTFVNWESGTHKVRTAKGTYRKAGIWSPTSTKGRCCTWGMANT
jgi:hypothetical protein